MPDRSTVVGALDKALEAILVARIALAPAKPLEPAVEALDAALTADRGFREARQQFSVAMAEDDLLGVEAAANAMVTRAAEVGFEIASSMYVNTEEETQ